MKTRNLILTGILLLLADQISKIFIKLTMTIGESIEVLGSWFQIQFIENPGAAFGFELGGEEWGKLILSGFRIVACVLIFMYIRGLFRKGDTPKGVLVGLTMILVGALGNVLDSAFYGLVFEASTTNHVAGLTAFGDGYTGFLQGKVVDMLAFEWFPPIFNLADSYITVAAFYLAIFQYKFFLKEDK